MTPPGSWLVSARVNRGLAYEAKGDFDRAKADLSARSTKVADAGSLANQATAKARLAVIDAPATPPAAAPCDGRCALAAARARRIRASEEERASHRTRDRQRRLCKFRQAAKSANDARAVAKSLRDIGFEVTEGIRPRPRGLETTIRLSCAGAVGARSRCFTMPAMVPRSMARIFLCRSISARHADVLAAMTDVDTIIAGLDDPVRTNIVILDACRNNPMADQPPAGRGGETRQRTCPAGAVAAGAMFGAGTLIAYATAPGQVALDGDGANSPFSGALARYVGTPGLEVQQMLTRVRAEVVASTKKKQVPWSSSSLLGEVYLVEK